MSIHMAGSLCCSPETTATLLIGCTPVQNKRLKFGGGKKDPGSATKARCSQMNKYSLAAQTVKYLPAVQETWVRSLRREDLLRKRMAPHSSILAWKIPWTEEPGRAAAHGTQRAGYD